MRTIIIALSLAANVALILHLQARPAQVRPSALAAGRDVPDGASGGRNRMIPFPRASAEDPGPEAPVAEAPRQTFTIIPAPRKAPSWAELSAATPSEFVARLAEAGWSQSDIRAALQARFAAEFAARRQELEAGSPGNPYWKYPSSVSEKRTELSAAQLRELRELARTQAKTLDEVAGANQLPAMPPSFEDQRRFDGIPADKIPFVRMIEEDYDDLATVAKRDQAIFPFPEDAQRLQMVEQEKAKDLKEILTPAEYAEYNVRNSIAADRLRNELIAFEPTEAEFRTILAVYEQMGWKPQVTAGRAAPDTPAVKAAVVAALGGRGPAYEQAINPLNRTAWIKAHPKQ